MELHTGIMPDSVVKKKCRLRKSKLQENSVTVTVSTSSVQSTSPSPPVRPVPVPVPRAVSLSLMDGNKKPTPVTAVPRPPIPPRPAVTPSSTVGISRQLCTCHTRNPKTQSEVPQAVKVDTNISINSPTCADANKMNSEEDFNSNNIGPNPVSSLSTSSNKSKSKNCSDKKVKKDIAGAGETSGHTKLEGETKSNHYKKKKKSRPPLAPLGTAARTGTGSSDVRSGSLPTRTTKILSPFELNFRSRASLVMRVNYSKAVFLYRDTLKKLQVDKRVEDVSSILRIQGIMADLLVQHHYLDEALDLLINIILEKEIEFYGRHHPETMRSRLCIASIFSHQEKWDRVTEFCRAIVEKREVDADFDEAQMIDAQHYLATALHKDDKILEATPIYKEIHAKAKRLWGRNHVRTVLIQFHLACAFQEQELYNEAYEIFHSIYEKRIKNLGPNHILSIRCESRIAHIVGEKGNIKRSIELFRAIARKCSHLFGNFHEITVNQKKLVVGALMGDGRVKEALLASFAIVLSTGKMDICEHGVDKSHDIVVFKSILSKVVEEIRL